MYATTIRQLKKGDFFTLKPYGDEPDARRVYIRGEYDRSSRRYCCNKFDDYNAWSLKRGDRIVYTDFIF